MNTSTMTKHHTSARRLFLTAAAATLSAAAALAFPTSHFTRQSKLATGKWVKIAVSTTGIHEITYDELRAMGFSNPLNVRLYGNGGHAMSEILSDDIVIDDLQLLPVQRYGEKICFYGLGSVEFKLNTLYSTPYYERTLNTCSSQGYYFLTENAAVTEEQVFQMTSAASYGATRSTSYDYIYHENDLTSPGKSGKIILGENIMNSGSITVMEDMSDHVAGTTVVAHPSVAAFSYWNPMTLTMTVGDDAVTFMSNYIFSGIDKEQENTAIYYYLRSPIGTVTPAAAGVKAVTVGLTGNGTLKNANLDYYTISYEHHNTLNATTHQTRIGIKDQTSTDRIVVGNATPTTFVWEVNNPRDPVSYHVSASRDGLGFTPGVMGTWKQYVAFDPAQKLLKISGYEAVDNQNLHAMDTPHMLIITTSEIMPQAQRVAQLHKQLDNMDVAVVDHKLIYNEFSSGTPDVMAYRLMCKMFYDRDPLKFKNLLIMGPSSFDNRQVLSPVKKDLLLSYQSHLSDDEEYTYCCDDFYGMLDDDGGSDVSSTLLSIGVGRIPSRTATQARSDVDKLEKYLTQAHYGAWRNSFLVVSDDYDGGLHEFQAQGLSDTIMACTSRAMIGNSMHDSQYYRSDYVEVGEKSREVPVQGQHAITSSLTDGQYFMSYVGHAGASQLGKRAPIWNNVLVGNTTYEHWPIVTMACCNVARYDDLDSSEGIAERMFHKSNGGAIALLASGRSCLASDNDRLNVAFTTELFSHARTGSMSTLGEVYLAAKQSFGSGRSNANTNKLTFMLMGDPAIKVNYPKAQMRLYSINGTAVTTDMPVSCALMQNINIVAHVMSADGKSIDRTFNGDATVSVCGAERPYRSLTRTTGYGSTAKASTREIMFPAEKYVQVSGRVNQGVLRMTIVVPASVTLEEGECSIKLFAHRDNSEEMMNGVYEHLWLTGYDPATAVTDTQAPVITGFYFNDKQDYGDGDMLTPNPVLHISATDNVGFNSHRGGMEGAMELCIDRGAHSVPNVGNQAAIAGDGKTMDLTVPLYGLPAGKHEMQFTVYDLAGNAATRSATFYVGAMEAPSLAAQNSGSATTFDLGGSLNSAATVTLRVTDRTGNVVWSRDNASFPLTWNQRDSRGKAVKPGIYKAHAVIDNGDHATGTRAVDVVVVGTAKK